ncbi:MAG TPA: class I SAM-dependent methyltransferase [Parafilimonas sp.]|nr:class I SAM-dependent methyltransferase [Parafilimonas sp.]
MENDKNLLFTGERWVTQINEYWSLEHLHRYAIASCFVKDKIVLDIASGEGYGSHLLAQHASWVYGVDISMEAIEHAQFKYSDKNLTFKVGSADEIPLDNHSIDTVISFETIEHHQEHNKMMEEIRRVLKFDGMLIMSSPDKKYYSDVPGYSNPFHVKELYKEEFSKLLYKYFANQVMLYQKSVLASIIAPRQVESENIFEYNGNFNEVYKNCGIKGALYNIAFASDVLLPTNKIREVSFFHDQDLLNAYIEAKKNYSEALRLNQSLMNSQSYKIGKLITLPLRKLKYFFR